MLAGIGTLPDTVADRSVPIRLQRKKPDEIVKDFRLRQVMPKAKELEAKIEQWVKANRKKLVTDYPDMPTDLSDRERDGCEPLLAIADRLGCGRAARAAWWSCLAPNGSTPWTSGG